MSRPSTPSPRPQKRIRLEEPSPPPRPRVSAFKNGVMLAPMVRSGALPTRLFALKYGAKLVWGPEIVDKAILHATREVDPVTGVISYNGVSRAMFTTHPIEKPYLIYQIGSADPELAVQAAKVVMDDVSGIDLNCGCPKPFSTLGGMGAALLTNPDTLCAILTALRKAVPPEKSVSAKIRLLPTQEETMKLVKRIVDTGVSALTVHCRTRSMRPRERALVERLREIVEYVESMSIDIAVIENGDCVSREDAIRLRELTGAHSCMIATAAESNPSCFAPGPLVNAEELILSYLQLSRYLDNHWSSTKHCIAQFKSPGGRAVRKELRTMISQAKAYDAFNGLIPEWKGEAVMEEISRIIERRGEEGQEVNDEEMINANGSGLHTPASPRENPEPSALATPFLPSRIEIPAMIAGRDNPTPSPERLPLPPPLA